MALNVHVVLKLLSPSAGVGNANVTLGAVVSIVMFRISVLFVLLLVSFAQNL